MKESPAPVNDQNNAPAPPTNEWSNPTPAGLVALAVACFCYFASLSGLADASSMKLHGSWLIGGFLVQFIVALVDLKSKKYAGGNTFLFFSAFFMLTGGIRMFVKHNAVIAGVLLDTHIDGYPWIVLTLALILWTPVFCKPFNLLSLVVLTLDVALPFITLLYLGLIPASISIIPSIFLLASGLIAIYLSAAMVVNTTFGRKVYPILEISKRK